MDERLAVDVLPRNRVVHGPRENDVIERDDPDGDQDGPGEIARPPRFTSRLRHRIEPDKG